MTRTNDPRDPTTDDLDEALSALDFVDTTRPSTAEPTDPSEKIFESHLAGHKPTIDEPPAETAPSTSEPVADGDGLEAVSMVRDAFGNRRRVDEPTDGVPQEDTKMLIQAYGLRPYLSRQVLSGKLKLETAVKLHQQKIASAANAPSEYRIVWTIAFGVLLIVAAVVLLSALIR